jgi:LuxR family maltose regulon positive regulatory protein
MSGTSSIAGPQWIVGRPALVARLDRAPSGAVTLLSAPAGSGKTVLIRSWLKTARVGVAWVSIVRGEADAQHFWAAVVQAIRTVAGAERVGPLAPTPAFDGAAAVERLLSDLDTLTQQVVLVVDDLHELASADALHQLEHLLARTPATLRVVLAFRGEVRLRLYQLRLEGALTELRASDLAFTVEEMDQLLSASGVALSRSDLLALHERTEGWAAGVRLAAISLAGHTEPGGFVAEFSGTDRTVADYLLGEVLERQPPEVRLLLLRTSPLERISGPLADSVTGGAGSEAMLRALEETGDFVVALDTDRTWFRYHHLFADLLRVELRRSAPEEVARVHAAAAGWFAANDHVVEAIGHAQAAGDWSQATGLLTDHYFSLTLDGRQATARGLLRSFPRDLSSADPEIALMLAADEQAQGSLDTSAAYVALAVRHAELVPADRRRRFDVGLALVRLSLARRRGDFESAIDLIPTFDLAEHPDTWLDIVMHNDLQAWALMNLGIVEAWSGRTTEGARHLKEARELSRRIGRTYLEVGCLAHEASTVTHDSFVRAQAACHSGVVVAGRPGWGVGAVIAPALVTLGAALAQTGRFAAAEQWLDRAEQTLRAQVEPAVGFLLHGVRGAVDLGRGRIEEALENFTRAEQLGKLLAAPPRLADQFRSATLRARLASDESSGVRAALASLSEEERNRGEFREVVAELALADGEPQTASAVLAPILDGSAPVHHANVVIRALLLEAVIRAALGEGPAVELAIERALDLAEPDRIVMPFAHGRSRDLLGRHPRHRTAHGAFLAEVLDVLSGASLDPVRGDPDPLAEALSAVELRVLRLLPSNLTAPEIGGELYVSTNTVKTHMRHIYSKLDAHSRAQAVAHARALGLLAPSGRHR